jgi:hypothetical protein
MLDRVHLSPAAPRTRRLLVRLALFAFCGGLLLLLSSRPADAAERREPRLLDAVGTTLKATAREVDSFAGRATGSRSSTVAKAADAAGQVVTPPPRPATGAARPVTSTVRRGAPAVTSPVRRAAPSTRPATSSARTAARSVGSATTPVTRTSTGPLKRAGKLAANPAAHAAKAASGPLGRADEVAGGPLGRAATGLCGAVDGRGNLACRCATLPSGGLSPGPGR